MQSAAPYPAYPRTAGRVLAIVPALNEERTLPGVLQDLKDNCPFADVLVIDDGSSDGTAAVADAAGVSVVRLPFHLGLGGAMRTGYRYAARNRYEAVVQVDADGQHDASYIAPLIAGLETADIVMGSRFAGVGDYPARGPRRWAMWLLAIVVSRLAKTRLTDVTSGFRALGPRAIAVFAEHYPAEYLGDMVALVIALRSACTIRQIPVAMRTRAGGRASQSSVQATVYLLRAVASLCLALVRRWTGAPRAS